MEWIRFIIGTAFLLMGLVLFGLELFGSYRFRFVLNRMHAAAIGDTLGIGISLIGLIIFAGVSWASLKMALVIVFLWCASPVSSHLISRLEVTVNEEIEEYCEVENHGDI